MYDTTSWTWWIPETKSTRMILLLHKAACSGVATNGELMTITGKINYYGKLIDGRFERGFLFSAIKNYADKDQIVTLGQETRIQLIWWVLNLRALAVIHREILDPINWFTEDSLVLYSDAAGGSESDLNKGFGVFNHERLEGGRMAWPVYIHENRKYLRERWASKLTVLEGFAVASAITWALCGHTEMDTQRI